jgi:hypothetical protein
MEEQNEQTMAQQVWEWLRKRGRDVTTGFARAYSWMYDLPYEDDTTTSDIIAAVEEGVEPYASTGPYRWLASPASPIDAIYHLAHPGGYQTTLTGGSPMEDQDREEVDFFRQVVQASVNLETGAPAALPTVAPETVDPSYVAPIYESVGLDVPSPMHLETTPTYQSVSLPSVDQSLAVPDYGGSSDPYVGAGGDPYIPQLGGDPQVPFGGVTSMTLRPFETTTPGALGPMGRRTLIKTWIAGPPGRRIQFWHFYLGNRKYTGCIKADGSWKQWPVYKPLVIGKTMTDRKAKRVARRLDSYAKSAKKILSVLGYRTSRGGRK